MANNKDFKVKNGIQSDVYYESVGNVSLGSGTASLDLSSGSVFELTPTEDVTVSLTNPAASGTSNGVTLLLYQQGYGGYDVGNAKYENINFSVASQDTAPMGLRFKSDGTKMFVLGGTGRDVNEYNLSTAWNVSTASYSQNFVVASQELTPTDLFFKPDGTKMYIIGQHGKEVNEYNLSTAWDVSTASHVQLFSVSSQETAPTGLFFKTDGTKMFVIGITGDDLNEYALSTAWDISTASFTTVKIIKGNLGGGVTNYQDINPQSLAFNSDGTKVFVLGADGLDVAYYILTTAWSVSTIFLSTTFTLTASEVSVRGLAFSNDGSKMYIIDIDDDTIRQYKTTIPATITYNSAIQWANGAAPTSPDIGDTDVITFNTTDGGTKYKSVLAIDGAK